MGEKIKKYAIVVFLTFLVWAWAFNALERSITRPATLVISSNPDSNIFATFDRPVPVEMNVEFKGTPDKIGRLIDRFDAGQENLEFKFNPENEKKESPYLLNVVEFLQNHSKTRKLELEVVKSSVESVQVKVEKLIKRPLKIKCVDESGAEIKAESITPSTVDIFVREGYTGDATVILSGRDIEEARKDYVIRIPYVELSPTDKRQGPPVRIDLPAIDLPTDSVQTQRIGYSFGKNIMGRYTIELQNPDELTSSISIKGTEAAVDTYRGQEIHIFVVALDGDEKKEGIITRPVVFNFSQKDVANGHIRLAKDEPREARFKLVKLPQTTPE
ncbi:MAG: hypothetical protein K9M75_00030 [Phycisphaerae bacterium]|nr:hypothetical protein [Phycisphaerae bacterium]